jgi:hypothetical protein
MDAASIAKDNCCAWGQWLYNDGISEFVEKPDFSAVVEKHKVFHTQAGRVAELVDAKKFAEVEPAIDSDTPNIAASNGVGVAIMALWKVIAQ